MSFGRTEFARPSRFLEDVPRELLSEIDVFGQELGDTRMNKYSRAVWAPPSVSEGPKKAGELQPKGDSYRGGERVKHPKFGAGTVVGVSGDGPRAEITVRPSGKVASLGGVALTASPPIIDVTGSEPKEMQPWGDPWLIAAGCETRPAPQ